MTTAPPAGARHRLVRRTFGSLAVRNFRLFIFGQLLSTTGTWMQGVAAPLLVLHLTHSGTALGIDTALQFAPILFFGAWGGVLADRFDNRRVQIATQIAYAIVALALWAIVATGVVTVEMVYALSFASGLVTAVDMPTRQSFYLEMVGPDALTNAMSLNTATFTGSRILGSALAGVLLAGGGYALPFLANGISYLAVVAALLAMRVGELHVRRREPARAGQIREAVRYVWRTPQLRLPILTMLVVFLFAFNFVVYLPLLVTRTFSERAGTLGALLSLWGVGSLAGALLMASRSSRPNPGRLARLAIALGTLSVLLAASPAPAYAAVLMPPLGAAFIAFAITGNATLQLTSSDAMRGRVMALYSVVFLGSTPLGGPIAGWIGEHLGAPFGLAASGVVAIGAGVAAILAGRSADGPPPDGPRQLS